MVEALAVEIEAVDAQGLGDMLLLLEDDLAGFAVCHTGPGTEAGSGACYVKFAATVRAPARRLLRLRRPSRCSRRHCRVQLRLVSAPTHQPERGFKYSSPRNHGGDAVTQGAKDDLVVAYNDAAGGTPVTNVPVELGGTTLLAGVYVHHHPDEGGFQGRLLGRIGAVTLDTNTITRSSSAPPEPETTVTTIATTPTTTGTTATTVPTTGTIGTTGTIPAATTGSNSPVPGPSRLSSPSRRRPHPASPPSRRCSLSPAYPSSECWRLGSCW